MQGHTRPDQRASSPQWFRSALDAGPERVVTRVSGLRIHWRAWGSPEDPLVVLIHGAGGQGCWWDHVGPYLATDRRVVALDLSGHGSSDHRAAYDVCGWAEEVAAVIEVAHAGRHDRAGVVLVGHCMGGYVAMEAASLLGTHQVSTILVEAPLTAEPPEVTAANRARAARGVRIHRTRREARERFRPVGGVPTLDYVVDHLSRQSVRSCAGGWRLRFDPRVFALALSPERVSMPSGRVAVVRGELGFVHLEQTRERCGPEVPVTTLPSSGHHPMLDQPLAFVTALRSRLDEWGVGARGTCREPEVAAATAASATAVLGSGPAGPGGPSGRSSLESV